MNSGSSADHKKDNMEKIRLGFASDHRGYELKEKLIKYFEKAADKNYINPEDIKKILEWNSDPEGWGKKYGFED